MNPLPLVSVAINNYNYGRFLNAAIESALNQSYQQVEVIVVDDGSTDESADVIAGYGSRITAIRQANAGQAAALNSGFARSRGDVVIFLDADDVLLPDIVETVAAAFRDTPDLARVQYRLAVVNADGVRTGERIPEGYSAMPSGDLRRLVARFNNYAWWSPTSGNAFSTKVLRQVLPMPDAYRRAADYYLVRAATLCGPIRSFGKIGALYRTHGANHYRREGLDVAQIRMQISLINDTHDRLREFAARIQFGEFPACASDSLDLPFFALRLTSLRLEREKHPLAADRLLPLAWRGAAVALRQMQRSLAYRTLAVVWFAAMVVSPSAIARSLAEWFFYPHKRPRFARPKL